MHTSRIIVPDTHCSRHDAVYVFPTISMTSKSGHTSGPTSDRHQPAVYAAAAFAVLVWAGTAIVTKFVVGRMDPLLVGVLRTVLAALIVAPAAIALGLPLPTGARQWRLLAATGIGGFVAFPIFFTLGLRYTSAAHTGLVLATLPVFTGLFDAIADRRWPRARWFAGASVAMLGEAFLIAFGTGLEGGSASNVILGDILVLAGAASASLGYVCGARLSHSYSSWATTFWGISLAGLLILPALWWVPAAAFGAGTGAWLAVIYLALGSTILAYVAWYWALSRGGISRIGLAQFLQPVLTGLLAALILGEVITLPLGLAAAVILVGIYIAQRR